MEKVIVFPAGRGVPYVADFPDKDVMDWAKGPIGSDLITIVRARRLPNKICFLVDDTGLHKPNELNAVASWFYETDKHGDPIVGTVVVVKEVFGPEGPELGGLSDEDVDKVFDLIGKE